MTKPLTKMADDVFWEIAGTNFAGDNDKLLALAKVVCAIAAKLEDEQPTPDVLDRVLALAKTRADELMKIAGEFTYSGLADYYRYGADCLYDFAATLRKEFNRD